MRAYLSRWICCGVVYAVFRSDFPSPAFVFVARFLRLRNSHTATVVVVLPDHRGAVVKARVFSSALHLEQPLDSNFSQNFCASRRGRGPPSMSSATKLRQQKSSESKTRMQATKEVGEEIVWVTQGLNPVDGRSLRPAAAVKIRPSDYPAPRPVPAEWAQPPELPQSSFSRREEERDIYLSSQGEP